MLKSIILGMAVLSTMVTAAELNKSQVSEKLQTISGKAGGGIKVEDVEQSALEDFYQVLTDKGILYVHKDGDYLFSGSMHAFKPGLENLTAARMQQEHKKEIDNIKQDFITYRAPDEKYEVIVFFDTSCGYCHQLHSQIAQYNALGITIHYAAYPRNGISDPRNPSVQSSSYLQLQNIWCAEPEQKNFVFDMVARGTQVPLKQCDNSIAEQFQLGKSMGIPGTPAIFAMTGEQIVPGYVGPNQLKSILEGKS